MNQLLTILLGLIIWGPPRLRVAPRSAEAAFVNPFNMDAAALFQVGVWLAAGIVTAVLVLRKGVPSELARGPLKWYLIFGMLGIASAVYSSEPFYSLFFALKIVIACLLTVYFVRAAPRDGVSRLLGLFFHVFLLQWLAIGFLYVVAPNLVGSELTSGIYRLNGGILLDYGMSASIAGLFFLARALYLPRRAHRLGYWLLYAVTWCFVAVSQTRTTVIGAALFALVLTLFHPKVTVRLVTVLLTVTGGLFTLASGAGRALVNFMTRNQGLESLAGLTGRVSAFSFLIELWKSAPVTGYGYGMSRDLLLSFMNDSGLGIGAAHDAVSKVLVELGLPGAFVLLVALVLAWREVMTAWHRSRGNPERYPVTQLIMALMVWATVSSVTSGGVADVSFTFIVASITAKTINMAMASVNVAKRQTVPLSELAAGLVLSNPDSR